MNENLELMMHVYKSSEMGVYTTTNLLDLLKNKENKIKHVLECELKEYEKYMSISEKILIKHDINPKNSGLIAKLSSDIAMNIETIKDNSDTAISQMLIQGFTMGSIEMESKYKKYRKICDKESIKIAKDFKNFQENEIEKLKTFM